MSLARRNILQTISEMTQIENSSVWKHASSHAMELHRACSQIHGDHRLRIRLRGSGFVLVLVSVATLVIWDRTSLVVLVGIRLIGVLVEMTRAQLATVQHAESPIFTMATAKHHKVPGHPLQHERQYIWRRLASVKELLPQLAATAIHVQQLGAHTKLAELRSSLRLGEDANNLARALDSSELMKAVLNGVDSSIVKIINVELLSETIKTHQLAGMHVEIES